VKALRRIYARLVFHPTLLWNLFNARVLKRWNWWDLVDDVVIIGALPSVAHVEELKTLGVVAVVNTCAEYHGPVVAYETAGIDQLSIPTVDYTAPTLENVQKAVDFIQRQFRQQLEVHPHHRIGQLHELLHHLVRRLTDADVVAQTLAHPSRAVRADQNR